MRTLVSTFIVLAISAIVSAQSSDLPQILIPSDQAKQEADRLDAQVFKIRPWINQDKDRKFRKDSEADTGIRGNGSFYSFSTGTHSINNLPEIYLTPGDSNVKPGELHLYANFGLMTDIGAYQLSKLTADGEITALKLLSAYRAPTTAEERGNDLKFRTDTRMSGITLTESLAAVPGHTYLIRSVRPERADILAAFTILRSEKDGSLEIAWKVLQQFLKPSQLYLSDVDLRLALQQTIDEKGIFKNIVFAVKDYEVELTGHTTRQEFETFIEATKALRKSISAANVVEDKIIVKDRVPELFF